MENERRILKNLRTACECFWRQDYAAYGRWMETLKQEIEALPERAGDQAGKDQAGKDQAGRDQAGQDLALRRNQLYGEWVLAGSLPVQMEIEKLIPIYRRAFELLGRTSRVIRADDPSVWNIYGPAVLYLSRPGDAVRMTAVVEEGAGLYRKLTRGGAGAGLLYRAQIAYYQGKTEEAGKLAEQAFTLAEQSGQGLNALYAAELLCHLSKYNRVSGLWEQSVSYLRRSRQSENRSVRETAECACAMVNMSVGILSEVPEWIRKGDFGAVRRGNGFRIMEDKILPSSLSSVMMAHIEYLLYSGQVIAALNAIDQVQYVFQIHTYPIYNAYLDLFRVCCYYSQKDPEEAAVCLDRALEVLSQDGFWLVAAEFSFALGELMEEAVRRRGQDAQRVIREKGADFWQRLAKIRQLTAASASMDMLTEQEQKVAEMVASGLQNKEIAAALEISVNTVKYHMSNILSKLELKNRERLRKILESEQVELAAWAVEKPVKNTNRGNRFHKEMDG